MSDRAIHDLFGAGLPARGAPPTGASPTAPPRRSPGLWRIATGSADTGMQANDCRIADGDRIVGFRTSGCAQPSIARMGQPQTPR